MIVSAADLGTNVTVMEETLKETFRLAAHWGALVLIDEADVFLEARSLHDMQRNAHVSVFLRELE